MFLVVVSIPGKLPCKFHGAYHGGIIGHNTRKALSVLLILVLVPRRSQVIALRKSYNDGCACSCSCTSCSCSCFGQVTGDSSKREL
jgi:hypothetical protein